MDESGSRTDGQAKDPVKGTFLDPTHMALTGESLTYNFWLTSDLNQDIPGLSFYYTKNLALALKPHFDGKKWHVPVITKWEVSTKWNMKSNEGEIIVAGLGGYARKFYLTHKELARVAGNINQLRFGDVVAELGQNVTWGAGFDVGDNLPVLNNDFETAETAIWVMRDLYFVLNVYQEHEIPATEAGFYPPNGPLFSVITYHWRTLSPMEYEERKSRL